MIPFPTELTKFALWLMQSGAAGITLALLLERIQKFKDWKSPLKTYAVIALFVGLPFVGEALLWALSVLPGGVVAAVQHYLDLALLGLLAWSVSQFAHKKDRDNPEDKVILPETSESKG